MSEIAANLRDGITREIRFVEYKLRKRQSGKNKKNKNKNKQKHGGGGETSSSTVRDFQSNQFSEDVAKAMPSSLGEEDLQLKVALAISKEEAEAAKKQAVNDKLRLEMAIKESQTAAEAAVEKAKTAQTPSPTSAAPKDPWAAPSSSATTTQNVFDPFEAPSTSTSSNSFPNDLWSSPSGPSSSSITSPPAAVQHDPWGTQPSSLRLSPPAAASPTKQTPSPSFDSSFDIFGDSTPAAAPVAKDPWATAPVSSTAPAFDPFAVPEQATPAQTFDPMADFDNLRVSPAAGSQQQQAPIPANHYSLNMNMLMIPVSAQQSNDTSQVNQQASTTPPKGNNDINNLFGGLVDLTPKPQARSGNPFDQKKPALSLNQLKVGSQPNGFDELAGIQPSATTVPAPNMNYGMMPAMFQPSPYGLVATNNSAYPPMAGGIPQNQSLF